MDLLSVCIEGGFEANKYEDIVYDGLFSLVDDILKTPESDLIQVANKNAFLFMQNNALCHKADCILKFLAENYVPVMEWPTQSPDLNPFGNLWTDFKTWFHQWLIKLFNCASKSLQARYCYAEVLQEVWYNQGMEMVEALIKLMPKHFAAIIEVNKGWTKF